MKRRIAVDFLTLMVIICVVGVLSLGNVKAESSESMSGNDVSGNNVEAASLGDVNLDGVIDYLDAINVLRFDVELETLTEEQVALADVTGDETVDYLDAIVILRYDAELIDGFDDVNIEEIEAELESESEAETETETETEEEVNILLSKTGNLESGLGLVYVIDLSDLTVDQLNSVVQIVADITVDSGYCNGIICGYLGGTWSCMTNKGEISGDGKTSGQFVWNLDGSLVTYDESGNLSAYAEVQLWRVAPFYDEDGNEADDGTAILTAVTLYDASGNIVKAF